MSKLTRYGWITDGPPPQLFVPKDNGKWVQYEEHARALEDMKRLLADAYTLIDTAHANNTAHWHNSRRLFNEKYRKITGDGT